MTMKELRAKIQKQVDELNAKYETLDKSDYIERANVLGRINGLLQASLMSFGK